MDCTDTITQWLPEARNVWRFLTLVMASVGGILLHKAFDDLEGPRFRTLYVGLLLITVSLIFTWKYV